MGRDWAGFQRMKKISLKPQWIALAFDDSEVLQHTVNVTTVQCYTTLLLHRWEENKQHPAGPVTASHISSTFAFALVPCILPAYDQS